MVIAERDGTSMVYRLADARILEVLDTMRLMLRDSLERQSDALAF
jgi:DNA-binding transcriptional ArsR family regulator